MKLKIFLDQDETLQDAEDLLYKAVTLHANGDVHQESFEDPAMQDVAHRMEQSFKHIYQDMLTEISEALDKQYLK